VNGKRISTRIRDDVVVHTCEGRALLLIGDRYLLAPPGSAPQDGSQEWGTWAPGDLPALFDRLRES
jgi:hypothetical protein